MNKKLTKYISIILVIAMFAILLTACVDTDAMLGENAEPSKETVETTGSENKELVEDDANTVLMWYEALQDNEAMPFTLTEKARAMLSEHPNLFLENKKDGLDAYTDIALEYKMLTKSVDKYGDKLIYLGEAYVVSIYETQMDDEMTLTEIQLMDAEANDYYCLSLCAYDNIFEEDTVSVYALPVGSTAFENVSGGTTLAIILAGCYIEKIA